MLINNKVTFSFILSGLLCIWPKNVVGGQEDFSEGVYEFVTEDTTLTLPVKRIEKRNTEEWSGLWFFKDGYFSITMMKRRRPLWVSSGFPKDADDMGYESAAGTYLLRGNEIQLKSNLLMSPDSVSRSILMEFRFKADTLTLTQHLHPFPEGMDKGERVTLLRRVK